MIPWLVLLQATLTIAVSGPYASPEYLPLRVAEAEGYFAEENLRVSLRTTRAEPGAAEALARGEADLAATALDTALRVAHVKGSPPRLVFGLTEAPPLALLVPTAHQDSISALSDLGGKAVGIPSPGAPEQPILLSLLATVRRRGPRVSLVSYGERGLAAALARGDVVAGLIGDPWATRLLEEGKVVRLVDLRQRGEAARWLGEETVHAGVFARADTRLRPAELVSLSRALLRAMARLEAATPEELAAKLPSSVVGLPEDFAARVEGARGIYLRRGWVSPEMMRAGVDMARRRASMPAAVRLPSRMDPLLLMDPLRQALDAAPR